MELTVPWVVLYICIGLVSIAAIAFPILVGKAPSILSEVNKLCPSFKAEEGIAEELPSACPICLCDLESEDVLRRLPCKHVFHVACIDPWLVKASECAMCRAPPLMPRARAASKPQATAYGSPDAMPPSDVELGLVAVSTSIDDAVEPSVDYQHGQDSGVEVEPDDISQMPSVQEPPAAGNGNSDAGSPLTKLMPRPVPGLLQEPNGQTEESTDIGTIALLECERELTPMYIPGVQDYHLGLQQPAQHLHETGENQEDLSDSAPLHGYVPLSVGLHAKTPMVLSCSL